MMEPQELRRWERTLERLTKVAGEGDPEQFAAIVKMLDKVMDEGLKAAAAALKSDTCNGHRGYSWTDLGDALGTTRQAAHSRFGQRPVDTMETAKSRAVEGVKAARVRAKQRLGGAIVHHSQTSTVDAAEVLPHSVSVEGEM